MSNELEDRKRKFQKYTLFITFEFHETLLKFKIKLSLIYTVLKILFNKFRTN